MTATQVLDKGRAAGVPARAELVGSTPHRLIHMTETPVLVVRGSLSSR